MKVVICGAGIAGLTLANRLAVLGSDVVLLERSPGPRTQGYMIDFFGPGYDTAAAMGLLPAIREIAYPIAEASLVDERGRRRASVRPTQFSDGPLLDVMRPDLEHVLREPLPSTVTCDSAPAWSRSPTTATASGSRSMAAQNSTPTWSSAPTACIQPYGGWSSVTSHSSCTTWAFTLRHSLSGTATSTPE